MGRYIDSYENITFNREKLMGQGIDLLGKVTGTICKKWFNKLYIEIFSLLDMLLKNGTMTKEDVLRY